MMRVLPILSGQLLLNEPLTRYNSWRVGGAAKRFYIASSLDDLSAFLQTLNADEPICFIGLGSNLLVRDGGVRGTSHTGISINGFTIHF